MTQEQKNIHEERAERIRIRPVGAAVLVVNSFLGNPKRYLPMLNFVAGVRPSAVRSMAIFIEGVQCGFCTQPADDARQVCIDMLTDLYDGHMARIDG